MADFMRSGDMDPSSRAPVRQLLFGVLVVLWLALVVDFLVKTYGAQVPRHQRGGKLSNIKQVLLASIMYGADYEERLPHRDRWMDAIEPLLKEKSQVHRPEIAGATEDAYGYAFLSHLSLFSFMNVKEPARLPVLYDSVNLARNPSDPFTSLPAMGEKPSRNLGFCDGHAKHVGVEGEANARMAIRQQFEGGSS